MALFAPQREATAHYSVVSAKSVHFRVCPRWLSFCDDGEIIHTRTIRNYNPRGKTGILMWFFQPSTKNRVPPRELNQPLITKVELRLRMSLCVTQIYGVHRGTGGGQNASVVSSPGSGRQPDGSKLYSLILSNLHSQVDVLRI